MSQLSRRTFFLSWLAGLLSGSLGQSQAQAAAPARDPAPNSSGSATTDPAQIFILNDGTLYYSAVLPPGVSTDSSTGLISGTISQDGNNPTSPLP